MSNHASIILAELREDHRNMALLLNLIEREANHTYNEDSTDFDLVRDIMVYMTVYPDAVHHPKEDQLYAELKLARPDLAKGMSKITAEHRAIAQQGLKLRETVEQVIAGQLKRRNAVVEDAMRYVTTLRSHMQWEDRDLFRRIDEMIKDGQDVIEKAVFVHPADPVFGPQLEQKFTHLFDSIKKAEQP